jgi:hypothetical protein
MNFKLTMTLVVVLLVLSIGFLVIQKNTPPQTKEGTASPLLVKKPESLKSITYLRDNSAQVKFEKSGDDWNMVEPVKAPVEPSTVGGIASSLIDMKYLRKFEPETSGDRSAESTGVAKSRNTIKFTDNTGKEYTLVVGYRTNEGGVFATLNGAKTIYALEANPLTQLANKDPDDFRKKLMQQLDASKIVKLEVKSGKDVDGKLVESDVTLAKTDGKWLVTAPVSARANSVAVQDILQALSNVQAAKFSTLDKNAAGLVPARVSVTAWVEEPSAATASAPATTSAPATAVSQPAAKLKEVTLQLGYVTDLVNRDSSSVYASLADGSNVFTYDRINFNKLNKELKDLRDPAVMPASVKQATAFTLTTDGAVTVAATSKDNAWSLSAAPTALSADDAAISQYLGAIADLRAIKFVDNPGDLKSLALDPPHMKIELTLPGQTQHEVLLVGKPEAGLEGGKITPVMRQGEPTVYQIQANDAAKLATTPVALRNKDIERLDVEKIRRIEITGPLATAGVTPTPPATTPATGTAPATAPATAAPLPPGVELERDGTHWAVKKDGETKPSDDSRMTALLADFTPLTASKYLEDKPLSDGTPSVTVTITVLEPTVVPTTTPATAPATTPATASAPAATSATAPATAPALLAPPSAPIGPDLGKLVTHTLRLYRQEAPATTAASAPATAPAIPPTYVWKAVWDHQSPAWTFEPNSSLVEHVTKDTYNNLPTSTGTAVMPPENP